MKAPSLTLGIEEEYQVVDPESGELRSYSGGQPIVFTSLADTRGTWDRDRLGQVISNLVGNAGEHGEPVSRFA
jgi:signal transduction histidine kinase